MGPSERKTPEPIVRTALGSDDAPARERRMQRMLSDGEWNHRTVTLLGAERLMAAGKFDAYTLDDTALEKQGHHSVGVANQYAGCVGGLTNCQAIVTVGVASEHVSALIAGQLFLPASWCGPEAEVLRKKTRIPDRIRHRTKAEIALEIVRDVREAGLPRLPWLCDSGYGDNTSFRLALDAADETYVAGASFALTMWPRGTTFSPQVRKGGGGATTDASEGGRGGETRVDLHTCSRPVAGSVAARTVAVRLERSPARALRRRPRPAGTRRQKLQRARHDRRERSAARAMAAPSLAGRREGANEGVALQPASRHRHRDAGPARSSPLAHRARPRGEQGDPWARPLRRAHVAGPSPPHRAGHRRRSVPRHGAAPNPPEIRRRRAFPPWNSRGEQRARHHLAIRRRHRRGARSHRARPVPRSPSSPSQPCCGRRSRVNAAGSAPSAEGGGAENLPRQSPPNKRRSST